MLSELYLRQQGRKKRRRTEMSFRESSSLGVFSGAPRFTELSAVPTAMPLTGEPQSARTPRQAALPQSQSRAVPSLEQERTFLPRSTMAVSKIPAAEQNPRSETAQRARTSPGTPQFSRHSTTSPKAPFPACQQQIRARRLHADKSWGVKRGGTEPQLPGFYLQNHPLTSRAVRFGQEGGNFGRVWASDAAPPAPPDLLMKRSSL